MFIEAVVSEGFQVSCEDGAVGDTADWRNSVHSFSFRSAMKEIPDPSSCASSRIRAVFVSEVYLVRHKT